MHDFCNTLALMLFSFGAGMILTAFGFLYDAERDKRNNKGGRKR